jgi:hypothetical protein
MTMPNYEGPERRQDYIELDQALEKVSHLQGAVTTLANAMSNAAPKQELAELRIEVRRDYRVKIYYMAAFSVISVVFIMFFVNNKFNHMNDNIQRGHDIITCMQTKTEAQRTGEAGPTALLLCAQTQKG